VVVRRGVGVSRVWTVLVLLALATGQLMGGPRSGAAIIAPFVRVGLFVAFSHRTRWGPRGGTRRRTALLPLCKPLPRVCPYTTYHRPLLLSSPRTERPTSWPSPGLLEKR
jgi:hypothetical protein